VVCGLPEGAAGPSAVVVTVHRWLSCWDVLGFMVPGPEKIPPAAVQICVRVCVML
jgi:hypothetical protein